MYITSWLFVSFLNKEDSSWLTFVAKTAILLLSFSIGSLVTDLASWYPGMRRFFCKCSCWGSKNRGGNREPDSATALSGRTVGATSYGLPHPSSSETEGSIPPDPAVGFVKRLILEYRMGVMHGSS